MEQTLEIDSITETLRSREALLRDLGATALYLFGSRARGEHRPNSDLDIFIDFDRTKKIPRLTGLIGIEQDLSEDLGVPVTITTRDALHPLMKLQIEKDAIRMF